MRLENALRWQRLRWFISLNFIRGFSQDLWLQLPIKALQENLQGWIDPERDLPTFGSDPRSRVYETLTWFKNLFGDEALESLYSWQRSVFVQGGDDRLEEFVWHTLAYELFHSSKIKLQEEDRFALQQFHEVKGKRLTDFNKRLSEASQIPLSLWDQKIIAAEKASLDTVLSSITSICSSNIFVLSWHETCTSRGLSFLERIFEGALQVVSEDKSGRLIFSANTLPFPSSWELGLERNLNGVVVVDH